MSAAFPEITPHYSSISPMLADAINDNLIFVSKSSKVLLEMIQKVGIVHDEAATTILSVVDNFKKKMADVSKAKPHCHSESYQKFISRIFEQMENQAKILQTVSNSFTDCVITPLQESIDKKKEVWKTCFFYTSSFQQQIRKKEEDLSKRYKDYSDSANKLMKNIPDGNNNKQVLMYHNSHNTYLLRLSSVNSMHNLLYTHVLPHVVHSIEINQAEMNDSLRHHIKYMFSVQKETLKKITKSVDKIDHATDKIDLVSDLSKFIKSMKNKVQDKIPAQQSFNPPKIEQNRRMSTAIDFLDSSFVLNKFTGPNLQRRLAALQQQTGELVDNIASLRAAECRSVEPSKSTNDPALEDLTELLGICDKEANLNVLLRQMELYTGDVTSFLGPLPKNVLNERKHSEKSPKHQLPSEGQRPHEFIQSRLMKPSQCFYCHKLVTTFVKGYVCKSCRMTVHKKCATNVPFCDGININVRSSSVPPSPMLPAKSTETAEVYDLIDLESDDDYDYFDDDEFDDAFSDDENNENDIYENNAASASAYQSASQSFPKSTKLPNDLFQSISSVQSSPSKPLVKPLKPTITATKPPPQFPVKRENVRKPTLSEKPVISKKPVLAPKPSLQAPPPISRTDSCVAMYDYHSTQPTDLSFTSGSVIRIVERTDADWWKGRCNDFEGYFPCSYVLEVAKDVQVLRVLYPFSAQDVKEMSVNEGDILVLIETDDDWVKVKTLNGEGLVPIAYVEFL